MSEGQVIRHFILNRNELKIKKLITIVIHQVALDEDCLPFQLGPKKNGFAF